MCIRDRFQHFAVADSHAPEDIAYTAGQHDRFVKVAEALKGRGVALETCLLYTSPFN